MIHTMLYTIRMGIYSEARTGQTCIYHGIKHPDYCVYHGIYQKTGIYHGIYTMVYTKKLVYTMVPIVNCMTLCSMHVRLLHHYLFGSP
jgi:hypothetical protein